MLSGGEDNSQLAAYLSASTSGIVQVEGEATQWVEGGAQIETPFVALPGLLSAQCVARGDFDYLEVKVNADPSDARTDDIPGDIYVGQQLLADWGLHLIDVDLAIGNLVEVVRQQAKAYAGE